MFQYLHCHVQIFITIKHYCICSMTLLFTFSYDFPASGGKYGSFPKTPSVEVCKWYLWSSYRTTTSAWKIILCLRCDIAVGSEQLAAIKFGEKDERVWVGLSEGLHSRHNSVPLESLYSIWLFFHFEKHVDCFLNVVLWCSETKAFLIWVIPY